MKIFIDSAILEEIKEAYSTGIVEGVTTNPSLIKKAVDKLKKNDKNVSLDVYIKEILRIAKGTPISLEVLSTDYKNIIKEARNLYKKFNSVARNVYIKIPIDPCFELKCSNDLDGVKAVHTLSKQNIPINCTLIFTPEQALLAAKAGAKYVSPYVGRENDYIHNIHKKDNDISSGIDLIKKCREIFQKNKIKTQILAASIRNPKQLREVDLAGADIATIPFNVLKDSLKHFKTLEGMKKFNRDAVKEYKTLLK